MNVWRGTGTETVQSPQKVVEIFSIFLRQTVKQRVDDFSATFGRRRRRALRDPLRVGRQQWRRQLAEVELQRAGEHVRVGDI